jgi:hypothetical protein
MFYRWNILERFQLNIQFSNPKKLARSKDYEPKLFGQSPRIPQARNIFAQPLSPDKLQTNPSSGQKAF